jgi:polar amino acid transport system permease protein
VADRVAFLNGGTILEEGAAHEVLSNPRHPVTARFLSVMEIDKAPEVVR